VRTHWDLEENMLGIKEKSKKILPLPPPTNFDFLCDGFPSEV
jgi:hypothetical protein